jgi:hypothetical protein
MPFLRNGRHYFRDYARSAIANKTRLKGDRQAEPFGKPKQARLLSKGGAPAWRSLTSVATMFRGWSNIVGARRDGLDIGQLQTAALRKGSSDLHQVYVTRDGDVSHTGFGADDGRSWSVAVELLADFGVDGLGQSVQLRICQLSLAHGTTRIQAGVLLHR